MKTATLLSILALAAVSCVLDAPASPDARAYPEYDGGRRPGFRDAGCGGGASGTSGTSGASGLACTDATPPAPTVDAAPACGEHTFRYEDNASSVWVTGSFTDWAPAPPGALPLADDGAGTWTLTTYLGPGHHTYKLVIDGDRWITDPANDQLEDDGSGNVNSVLELCAPQ